MIRQATADDIKAITRRLAEQAQELDQEFDFEQALDSTRRQAILANSTVLVAEDGGEIRGVLFAVLTSTGVNTQITAQITNIWSLDHDQDRAQAMVDYFLANVTGVDDFMISQYQGHEYDLRGLEPVITTYRIR